jgi:fluoride exporter
LKKDDVPVLGVIAVGGGIGALARYAMELWLPHERGHVPWATLSVNALGCFLMGVLMVLITEVWTAHRLVRPFLGVGILGGFTTFSTYAVEVHGLFDAGVPVTALLYLVGTAVAAVAAVALGVVCTRAASGISIKPQLETKQ